MQKRVKRTPSEFAKNSMVMDFAELSRIVNEEVINAVDHRVLNDVVSFPPTSETMTIFIFQLLKTRLLNLRISVERLVLWETPTSCVEFTIEQ